jgi:hypothetical protein
VLICEFIHEEPPDSFPGFPPGMMHASEPLASDSFFIHCPVFETQAVKYRETVLGFRCSML